MSLGTAPLGTIPLGASEEPDVVANAVPPIAQNYRRRRESPMGFLRQSTSQVIRIGPFVDSTDGVTPETGLTIANTDIDLSKDGGAFASKNSGGATVDGSNGWYSATLDTTDTATVGVFLLEVTVAGALPVWHEYAVLEEAVFDALYDAGATGYNTVVPPSVAQFDARTLLAASYFDPDADTVANVTLVATTTTNTDMVGTDGANTVVPPSVAQFDARTLPTASYFDPDADTVANVTTVATTTTNTDMRGTDSAGVNAEMLDVLTTDTFAEVSGVPAATSTILDKLNWLFTLGRNKITQTSTTQTLRDDADSADIATATVSDDTTTFVRNEYT